MAKIAVVGSFVVGLTLRVPRPPHVGESLVGDSFDFGPGGKGTNQAVAAARQGASVDLLAAVGDDLFAEVAFDLFESEGVATDHVHRMTGINTGVGFVTLLPGGENWIVVDLGANLHMTPQHVDAFEDRIAAAALMLCQLEVTNDVLARALDLARAHGVFTVLNPGPARTLPPSIFQQVDLLTPNQSEARILLGLPPDDATPTDVLARRLIELGVKQVVVTLGKDGALIVDAHGAQTIPAVPVSAVDSTGAGDAFNAALAVALAEGKSLCEAVQLARYAGAYAVTRLGVIDGLAGRAALKEFRKAIG
ncbi:ribokinase [bacterium]|nr:ribokinase [bacterium]